MGSVEFSEEEYPYCTKYCAGIFPGNKHYQNQCKACMDPHLCKDSCEFPSPGCKACSNPDYFQCFDSGQCIHPDLVCDQHPQCTNGEDEDFLMCKEVYRTKGLVKPESNFKCQSVYYPQNPAKVFTLAVICDGVAECLNAEDEKIYLPWTVKSGQENIVDIKIIFISIFMIVLTVLVLPKSFRKCFKNTNDKSDNALQLISLNIEEFTCQNRNTMKLSYYLHIMQNKDTAIRIDFNRNLFKNEIEIHGERQQVLLCMKNRLSWKICSQIMDDESPGFLVKNIPKTISPSS